MLKAVKHRIVTAIESIRFRKIRKADISIISNNCIAGLLYHHFGCRFMSPTINLQMAPEDFVLFCERMGHYLSVDLCESDTPENLDTFKRLGGTSICFPVGKLDGLTVFFQHYDSFAQAKDKWKERVGRINTRRLYFILVDTNCSEETVRRFFSLPYRNKLFLTSNKGLVFNPMCVMFHGEPWFESDWMTEFNFKEWFEKSSV